MSKKNRHKSRPSQRPAAKPEAAVVFGDRAVDAPVADDALDEGPEGLAGDDRIGVPAVTTQAAEPGGDAMQSDGAAKTGSTASASSQSDPGDLDDDAAAASAHTPAHATAADHAPLASAPPTPAPMASSGDIRGVLIQVAGARLLMPNATIAEVLSYADPEPVGESAPAWLLGRLRWRGWQVPLIAFGTLAGVAQERAALGSKVVVLKALAGTSRTPYFAMLTQGFPRLVTVSRQALAVEGDDAATLPQGVQARVRLNEDPALLPDLEAIEALVADAVAQAA